MSAKTAKMTKNQITEGVIWKQLLLFFFPILFGTLFQQIYNTADTLVVGRFVGKSALAAVGGSASLIVTVLVGFFIGLSSGAAVVIAQFYGAKNQQGVSRSLHTAIIFSVIVGIVMTVFGIVFSEQMLSLMKTPEDSMRESVIYLRIYFAGMVGNLIYNMGAGILRAVGDSRRPLYVLIVTCILNIILDVLFVVIFHMGVAGVACATILSQAISAIIVLGILLRSEEIYRLRVTELKLSGDHLRRILRIGIPTGLESTMYNFANLIIQIFINRLGTDTVAAWGTLGKIDAVFWMVENAFSIAIITFVGQNYGAGKYKRMRKSVRICLAMSMAAAFLVILLLFFIGEWFFGVFTTDQNVIRIGVHMLHFMMQFYAIYVVIGILSGALRGTGNVLVPMLLTLGGVCGLRIVWMFVVVNRHPSVDSIMMSYPVSWVITSVLFVIYYFKVFPREKQS